MANNLRPWLASQLEKYLAEQGRILEPVCTNGTLGKPLQVKQFFTERVTKEEDVWAEAHDKESKVLVRFDKAAVKKFESKVGSDLSTYQYGLFKIHKWYWLYTREYVNGKTLSANQIPPRRMILHAVEFEYISSKGTHDFGFAGCKNMNTITKAWSTKYGKQYERRNIPIAPLHNCIGTTRPDTEEHRTRTGSQYSGPKEIAPRSDLVRASVDKEDNRILAQQAKGLGSAASQARSAKTPPLPGAPMTTSPRHQSSGKRQQFQRMLRQAGSVSRSTLAKSVNPGSSTPSHAGAEPDEMYKDEVFTRDEDEAMPDTPPPPPSSSATSAMSTSSPGRSPSRTDKGKGKAVAKTAYQRELEELAQNANNPPSEAPSDMELDTDTELEKTELDKTTHAILPGNEMEEEAIAEDASTEESIIANENRLRALAVASNSAAEGEEEDAPPEAKAIEDITERAEPAAEMPQSPQPVTVKRKAGKSKGERLTRYELSSQASEPDYILDNHDVEPLGKLAVLESASAETEKEEAAKAESPRLVAASALCSPPELTRQSSSATEELPELAGDLVDPDQTIITGKEVLSALFDGESQVVSSTPRAKGSTESLHFPLLPTSTPTEITFESEDEDHHNQTKSHQILAEDSEDDFEFVSFIAGDKTSSVSPNGPKEEESAELLFDARRSKSLDEPITGAGGQSLDDVERNPSVDEDAGAHRQSSPIAGAPDLAAQHARQMMLDLEEDTREEETIIHDLKQDEGASVHRDARMEATDAARRMMLDLESDMAGTDIAEANSPAPSHQAGSDVFGPRADIVSRSRRQGSSNSTNSKARQQPELSFELEVSRADLQEWTRLASEPPEVVNNLLLEPDQNGGDVAPRSFSPLEDMRNILASPVANMLPKQLASSTNVHGDATVTQPQGPKQPPGSASLPHRQRSTSSLPNIAKNPHDANAQPSPHLHSPRHPSASLLPPFPQQAAIHPKRTPLETATSSRTQTSIRTSEDLSARKTRKRKSTDTPGSEKPKKIRHKPFDEDVKAQITSTHLQIKENLFSLGLNMEQSIGLWYCCSGKLEVARTIASHNLAILDSDNEQDPSDMPEHVKDAFKQCWTPEDDDLVASAQSSQNILQKIDRYRGLGSSSKRKVWLLENELGKRLRKANPSRYPYS